MDSSKACLPYLCAHCVITSIAFKQFTDVVNDSNGVVSELEM